MMVRCQPVGGAPAVSATKAVHAIFLDVARIRADRRQLGNRGIATRDDDVLTLQHGFDELGKAGLRLGNVHTSHGPMIYLTNHVGQVVAAHVNQRNDAESLRCPYGRSANACVSAIARSRVISGRISPTCFSFMRRKIVSTVGSSRRSRMGAADSGFMPP